MFVDGVYDFFEYDENGILQKIAEFSIRSGELRHIFGEGYLRSIPEGAITSQTQRVIASINRNGYGKILRRQ